MRSFCSRYDGSGRRWDADTVDRFICCVDDALR
jgi:hypothetical protein